MVRCRQLTGGASSTRNPKLGTYIARQRKRRGLSLQQIADAVGVRKSVVHDWEHGVMTPKLASLERLADVLEVPLDDLLARAGLSTKRRLPEPDAYLRARFPRLPDEAIDTAVRYLFRLARKHGAA